MINNKADMYSRKGLLAMWMLFILVHTTTTTNINEGQRHPMLYFDWDDVAVLQQKAATTHLKISRQITEAGTALKAKPDYYLPPETAKQFNSRWNEVYGNNLCAFAMYCLLNPTDKKAFELVKVFMKRLAEYETWYVTSSPGDEVPIGHTLTGLVTAYDFLYDRLGVKARAKYLEKIKQEANSLLALYKKGRVGWTHQHVHNHAPTVLLGMLLSALVYEPVDKQIAAPWKEASTKLFERTLYMFSFVTDGSIDEGVAYGSYTTRGLFQYIFLAKRHLNKDHTDNPWLREQLMFNYATVLPGFQRTVGIADSNHNWFYGPECQLVFLDAYVLRNGWGNWLADRVRESRAKNQPLAPSSSQKWSLTHLELVFYDDEISPVKPSGSRLNLFHDWGVVTYGGGEQMGGKSSTFLSFKSGTINGEAASQFVREGINFPDGETAAPGWWHFNAGHEHPDQNSFVFAPNGRYFVAESLYGTKLTSMNAALMFSPHVTEDSCEAPWEGQIGECGKWLTYKQDNPVRGSIVTVTEHEGMVHIGGDATLAYKESLGLKSVERSLVLLKSDLLVVVDTVYFKSDSKVKKLSSYFQNVMQPFKTYKHRLYNGVQVKYPEGAYSFFWFTSHQHGSPMATTSSINNNPSFRAKSINLVNITFESVHQQDTNDVISIAYVFHGPRRKVGVAKFDANSSPHTARLSVSSDDITYRLEMTSLSAAPERQIADIGFRGYLRLTSKGVATKFGMAPAPTINRCKLKDGDRADINNLVRAMMISCETAQNELKRNQKSVLDEAILNDNNESMMMSLIEFLILNPLPFWCLLAIVILITGITNRTTVNKKFYINLVIILVIWCFLGLIFSCTTQKRSLQKNEEVFECNNENYELEKTSTIIITGLPFSGAELLRFAFSNVSDFLYLPEGGERGLGIPSPTHSPYDTSKFDMCIWPAWTSDTDSFMRTSGWFQSIKTEPSLLLNNLPDSVLNIDNIRKMFRKMKRKGTFVLNFSTGFWNTKLAWLRESIGVDMRPILVVRDPRDWIYSLTNENINHKNSYRLSRIVDMFLLQGTKSCAKPARAPRYHEQSSFKRKSVIEQLARVWAIAVSEAVSQGRSMQIVRYEDMLLDPVKTFQKIVSLYGVTLSLPQINKVSRYIHSGHFNQRIGGPLKKQTSGKWRDKMSIDDVRKIENICGPLMQAFMYTYR